MLEQRDMEEALNDANAGLEKCNLVMDFLKRRQAIEEDYTRSMKKLCNSVNLKQVKHGGFLCFGGQTVIEEPDESNSEYVKKSTLWRSFYDMVEDSSQVAKGHGMLAETIRTQLLDPLEKAIKSMQLTRKTIQADLDMLFDESDDATRQYEQCKRAMDKADIAAQQAHQRLDTLTQQPVLNPQHADKLRLTVQKADDAADLARSQHRQAEERLRAVSVRHHSTEFPRVLHQLRRLEAQLAYDAYKTIHGLLAAEQVASDLSRQGVEEMRGRVTSVDLEADLRRYDAIYGRGGGVEEDGEQQHEQQQVQMQRIDTADSVPMLKSIGL